MKHLILSVLLGLAVSALQIPLPDEFVDYLASLFAISWPLLRLVITRL